MQYDHNFVYCLVTYTWKKTKNKLNLHVYFGKKNRIWLNLQKIAVSGEIWGRAWSILVLSST